MSHGPGERPTCRGCNCWADQCACSEVEAYFAWMDEKYQEHVVQERYNNTPKEQ